MIPAAVALAACAQLTPAHRSDATVNHGAQVRVLAPPSHGPEGSATGVVANANGQANAPPAAPPEPLSPFDDAPVIFTIAGQHFTRGERVIVTVCLAPDHSIASSDIFEYSGDSKFDQLAVLWARRIRLRAAAQGEQLATCGAVRVEVRPASEPRVFESPGDSLS